MIFGIDFGTTNSYLSARSEEGVFSERAVPSEIEGREGVFSSIKRYLGRRTEELDDLGLDYILIDGQPRIAFDGETFSPEELAARVFSRIAQEAVQRAVVAVPAHYDDGQRQATRRAAEMAGISVLRLVHEPTAAALACGVKGDRILVFDLGGGTLDVSLMEQDDDLFEVLRTAGDRNLGGDDLDILLASEISQRTGVAFSRDLLRLAQKTKHALSEKTAVEINPGGKEIVITRQDLEKVAVPFLERVEDSLRHFRDSDPEALVLVGGMSRMPAICHLLENFFSIEATSIDQPETAVARGAATYAASLAGDESTLLLDITPLSLGVEVDGGRIQEVVPGGTTIPLFCERIFTTSRDNQLSVEINVFQGESEDPEESRLLGKMHLMGIPPAPAGVPDIWVSFQIDENGIFSAWAHHPESDLKKELRVSERAFSDTDLDTG